MAIKDGERDTEFPQSCPFKFKPAGRTDPGEGSDG
jgi:hypothetical protein